MSTAGNMFSILVISIDRYIYIAHSLRYHAIVTRTRVIISLTVVWAYICLCTPIMFLNNQLRTGTPCKYGLFLESTLYKYFINPQFFIIILLTIGFYVAIAKIAYKQSRAIAALNQPYDTIEASAMRDSWRIIKMLGTVLGVYLLSILPQYSMTIVLRSYGASLTLLKIEKITVLIYYANSWVNPLIYVWKLKDFKTVLRKLLKSPE